MGNKYNGKDYGCYNILNYTAAPDYSQPIDISDIETGNTKIVKNGFLLIEVRANTQTQFTVYRDIKAISETGLMPIYKRTIMQTTDSEILFISVLGGDYVKLVKTGEANVLSCVFYPYAMK